MWLVLAFWAQSTDELVARLGDDAYAVREEAHRKLIESGKPSELRTYFDQARDPEIKDRLERILRSLTPLVWATDLPKGKPALVVSTHWMFDDSEGLRDLLFSDLRMRFALSGAWNLVWHPRERGAVPNDWSRIPSGKIDFLFVDKQGRVLNVVKGLWTVEAFLNEVRFAENAIDADREQVVRSHYERWNLEAGKNDPDRSRVSTYEVSHRIAFQPASTILQDWVLKHAG